MRAVVLGGAGAMGRVVVMDLSEMSEFDEIVIADCNTKESHTLADKLKNEKIRVIGLDASVSSEIDKVLEKAIVVVNCMHHDTNLQVMDSALRTGTHYLDLGGLFWVTKRQMELNSKWQERGLTAILGMGSSPGATNIMARYVVDQLDFVDSIHVRFAAKSFVKGNRALTVPYALSTFLDEFSLQPPVFENGELKMLEPISGMEKIFFPDPIGEANFIYTIHSEVLTLPLSFKQKGLKNASFKIALPTELADKLRFLVQFGFASKNKIPVSGTEVSPRDFIATMYSLSASASEDTVPNDYGIVRVYVTGEYKGSKTETIMEMGCGSELRNWGVGSGALRTGISASVAAQLLAKGDIEQHGAVAAEQCVPPKKFFEELSKRGIAVYSINKQKLT